MERPAYVRPGYFSVDAWADRKRMAYDIHNETLLALGLPVAAVFIGDSITDMWPLELFFAGAEGLVVNRGIGGDRTPFMRRRFEADVLQLRPRLAVVAIGVNNTWDLDAWDPLVARGPEIIEEEIVSDAGTVLEIAMQAKLTVALGSILPTRMPANGNCAARNELIARVNQRLRQTANDRGAIFVDYHRALVDPDGVTLRAGMADDGLHPHVGAYDCMASVLLETLVAAGITVLARLSPTR